MLLLTLVWSRNAAGGTWTTEITCHKGSYPCPTEWNQDAYLDLAGSVYELRVFDDGAGRAAFVLSHWRWYALFTLVPFSPHGWFDG